MNGNPRLDIDENTYIEARFQGKELLGFKKVDLGQDKRSPQGKLRNTDRPRIKIVDSFIPNDFHNKHPDKVANFFNDIAKRKKG